MAERARYGNSHYPELDSLDEEINGPRPYQFARSTNTDFHSDESMPIFLSSEADDAGRQDFEPSWEGDYQSKRVRSSRLLKGVVAGAVIALVGGLLSVDATRTIIIKATASIAGVLPIEPATAQPEATKLTASDVQLKDPSRHGAPAAQPVVNVAAARAAVPTREEIAAAYQSMVQNQAAPRATPAPAPVQAAVAAPLRRIEPDDLAAIMKRARGLIEIGDIAPARLLLERAANAQEPTAALLLAQTYDPVVLGNQDMRSITADPAKARAWYQQAAQFGSREAQQRLAQLQN